MDAKDLFRLVVSLGIPQIAGGVGALFTTAAIPTWYATLVRPALAPPNWVFAPVWTTLYVLMGVALFLVWKRGVERKEVRTAISLFALQLTLNVLWSLVFFGLMNIGGALVEIAVLWLAILATILAFSKISRLAAWLLVPYILWVSFAAYLNYSFWVLN